MFKILPRTPSRPSNPKNSVMNPDNASSSHITPVRNPRKIPKIPFWWLINSYRWIDDDDIIDIDLLEIDKSIDYNGPQSEIDETYYLNPNDKK